MTKMTTIVATTMMTAMTTTTTMEMTMTMTMTSTYWCRGHILPAMALHFVLRQCFLCRGVVLCAAAMLFSPRPCSLCRGVVLPAAALCYMPRRRSTCRGKKLKHRGIVLLVASRNDAPQRFSAFLAVVSSCLGKKRPAAAFRSMLRHVLWRNSLCRGQVCCAAVVFFVPRQETTCRSI